MYFHRLVPTGGTVVGGFHDPLLHQFHAAPGAPEPIHPTKRTPSTRNAEAAIQARKPWRRSGQTPLPPGPARSPVFLEAVLCLILLPVGHQLLFQQDLRMLPEGPGEAGGSLGYGENPGCPAVPAPCRLPSSISTTLQPAMYPIMSLLGPINRV